MPLLTGAPFISSLKRQVEMEPVIAEARMAKPIMLAEHPAAKVLPNLQVF
jgi:hypothetical protein